MTNSSARGVQPLDLELALRAVRRTLEWHGGGLPDDEKEAMRSLSKTMSEWVKEGGTHVLSAAQIGDLQASEYAIGYRAGCQATKCQVGWSDPRVPTQDEIFQAVRDALRTIHGRRQ